MYVVLIFMGKTCAWRQETRQHVYFDLRWIILVVASAAVQQICFWLAESFFKVWVTFSDVFVFNPMYLYSMRLDLVYLYSM